VIWLRPRRGESRSYETDPTTAQYAALERTCSHLAEQLFEGRLPKPLLVLNRGLEAATFFGSSRWWAREDGRRLVSEIALNPDMLKRMSERDVAIGIVHELTHLWQDTFGAHLSRPGYHNLEWSKKLESTGLMPSDTGREGGARVGQTMRQWVIPGGRFEAVYAAMPKAWLLPFLSDGPERKKDKSKSKFACPTCGDIARGKPSLLIDCRKCKSAMKLEETEMET
jgi:hypothetical protein